MVFNQAKMTTKDIINELQKSVGTHLTFGNHNTSFIMTVEGEMIMCEYCKDCKYTRYFDMKKFARRMLKFYKIGY